MYWVWSLSIVRSGKSVFLITCFFYSVLQLKEIIASLITSMHGVGRKEGERENGEGKCE